MQFTSISASLIPADGSQSTMLHTVLKGSVALAGATRADSKIMHHVAKLMHSSTRPANGVAAPLLPGSIFLKTPGVIVHATASLAPLFFGEMEVVAIATGRPVLLLRRSTDGSSSGLTVDVALTNCGGLSWYLEYRLFRSLAGDSWLVPPGSGPSIQLMRHGLLLSDYAPYTDTWEYDAGLERAAAYLASHRIGGLSW